MTARFTFTRYPVRLAAVNQARSYFLPWGHLAPPKDQTHAQFRPEP